MYIFVLCYVLLCVYLGGIQENIILGELKTPKTLWYWYVLYFDGNVMHVLKREYFKDNFGRSLALEECIGHGNIF